MNPIRVMDRDLKAGGIFFKPGFPIYIAIFVTF